MSDEQNPRRAPCPECKQTAICARCKASIYRVVDNVRRGQRYNFMGQLPILGEDDA